MVMNLTDYILKSLLWLVGLLYCLLASLDTHILIGKKEIKEWELRSHDY